MVSRKAPVQDATPITLRFSNHAIGRKYSRDITEKQVWENVRECLPLITRDFEEGELQHESKFRIMDRQDSMVTVCGLVVRKGRIREIVVITCFYWDGRTNISNWKNYEIHEEGPAYLEAKQWNEENQDKVMEYSKWKHHDPYHTRKTLDIYRKQADARLWKRIHGMTPKERIADMNKHYDDLNHQRRKEIHDALPEGDLEAIRRYFNDMPSKHIYLKPMDADED